MGAGDHALYEILGVGYGILADNATYLTSLTNSKGNAWDDVSLLGVTATSDGYTIILEDVSKKGGSSYEELSVTLNGEVAKKAEKISLDELADLEPIYNVDINKDGYIGDLLSYDTVG